jgi:hypothetical protein
MAPERCDHRQERRWQRLSLIGPAGGIFPNAIFSQAHGEATVFVPSDGTVRAIGRVAQRVVPAVELATLVHKGSPANIDLAYGEPVDFGGERGTRTLDLVAAQRHTDLWQSSVS